MERYKDNNKDSESQVGDEEKERSAEMMKIILDHLIQEASEIGSGHNGVVFKVDMKKEDFYEHEHITKDDWRGFLRKMFDMSEEKIGEIIENPSAGKVLKVYMPGAARGEFNGQTNVNKATFDLDPEKYAKIPGTFFSFTMENISNELKEKMISYGIKSSILDVFFMEYIDDAIEIREHVYRKIIDKCDQFSDLKDKDGGYKDKKEIYEKIENALGCNSKQAMVFDKKMDLLIDFLRENNIQIEEDILNKIELTMNYLHNEQNIFHNDLHDRNILIKKVDDNFMVYIIDWATASRGPKRGNIDDDLLVYKLRSAKYKKH